MMSPRYFWVSILIVIGLTIIIGFITQRKSGKELGLILIQVTCWLATFVGIIIGLTKLLVVLGIAEEGFVL